MIALGAAFAAGGVSAKDEFNQTQSVESTVYYIGSEDGAVKLRANGLGVVSVDQIARTRVVQSSDNILIVDESFSDNEKFIQNVLDAENVVIRVGSSGIITGEYESSIRPDSSFDYKNTDRIEAVLTAYEWALEALSKEVFSGRSPHPAYGLLKWRHKPLNIPNWGNFIVQTNYYRLAGGDYNPSSGDGDPNWDFWVIEARTNTEPFTERAMSSVENKITVDHIMKRASITEYAPTQHSGSGAVSIDFGNGADWSYDATEMEVHNYSSTANEQTGHWVHKYNIFNNSAFETTELRPALEVVVPEGTRDIWEYTYEYHRATLQHGFGNYKSTSWTNNPQYGEEWPAYIDIDVATSTDHDNRWSNTEQARVYFNGEWSEWLGDKNNSLNSDDQAFAIRFNLVAPTSDMFLMVDSETAADHENRWGTMESDNAIANGGWTEWFGDNNNNVGKDDQGFRIDFAVYTGVFDYSFCALHVETRTAPDHNTYWKETESSEVDFSVAWTGWLGDQNNYSLH